MKFPPLAQIRKAIINVTGLLAGLVTLGFLHGTTLVVVNAAIAVLTAVVHYSVRNAPAVPAVPPAA